MTCSLLDLFCHAQNGLWNLWSSLPWHIQALYVLGVLLVIGGIVWSFTGLLRAIGGWPAVAGVGAVILALVLSFIPRKPTRREPIENVDGDAGPVLIRKPKAPRKPSGRVYDRDTNTWKDR